MSKNFVDIKSLTLDEILKYGCLGELSVSSIEDWNVLSEKIDEDTITFSEHEVEVETLKEEANIEYNYGYEKGYDEGWDAAMGEKD